MNIKRELKELVDVCIRHFNDFCHNDSKRIKVFSITLENRDIWGGNGELDTTETIYITKDGWFSETITMETGLYQKNNPVISSSTRELSSDDVENILNGDKASLYEVSDLIGFYQNIRKEYSEDFYVY